MEQIRRVMRPTDVSPLLPVSYACSYSRATVHGEPLTLADT